MNKTVAFLAPFVAGLIFAAFGVLVFIVALVTAGIDAASHPAVIAISSGLVSGGLGLAGGTIVSHAATPAPPAA